MKKTVYGLMLLSLPFISSCGGGNEKKTTEEPTKHVSDREYEASKRNTEALDDLNNQYRDIPDEKILDDDGEKSAVYAELKQRYKDELAKLKSEVEATGAKFAMVIMTPEVGKGLTNISRFGHPYIKQVCTELGIDLLDLSPDIAAQDVRVITQSPRDGHWSKKGSVFIANLVAPIIKKYGDNKAKTTYKDSERPETFGDLPPHDDEILDGGKDMPYHVTANAQGLRMKNDVKFPKTKQHVFFMGGSQVYSPFLDNEFIWTEVLAQQFPDKVIMNSGMISGTIDDYLSLWEEKAKYAEPDLVIMQTNGGDITDLFFTNRNHLARSKKPYTPTPTEEKYYKNKYTMGH